MAKAGNAGMGEIALPIHEAIVPLMYRAVGVSTNVVLLGCRKLNVPAAANLGYLLLSFHLFVAGNKRVAVGPNWQPDDKFFQDFAVMSCIDRVIGQSDRHDQNYMVDGTTLIAVDNGRCMGRDFLATQLQEATLDELRTTGGRESQPWSPERLDAVKSQIAPLNLQVVDAAFDAIPRVWQKLHDAEVVRNPGHAQAGTLDQKREIVKINLGTLTKWLRKQ